MKKYFSKKRKLGNNLIIVILIITTIALLGSLLYATDNLVNPFEKKDDKDIVLTFEDFKINNNLKFDSWNVPANSYVATVTKNNVNIIVDLKEEDFTKWGVSNIYLNLSSITDFSLEYKVDKSLNYKYLNVFFPPIDYVETNSIFGDGHAFSEFLFGKANEADVNLVCFHLNTHSYETAITRIDDILFYTLKINYREL